jgi:hypothetical protein
VSSFMVLPHWGQVCVIVDLAAITIMPGSSTPASHYKTGLQRLDA